MLIKVPELSRLTGATQRQIRYWVEIDLIIPYEYRRGSGFYMLFDERIIPKVKFLAQISNILRAPNLFQKIADNYNHAGGHIYLGDGFVLSWPSKEK